VKGYAVFFASSCFRSGEFQFGTERRITVQFGSLPEYVLLDGMTDQTRADPWDPTKPDLPPVVVQHKADPDEQIWFATDEQLKAYKSLTDWMQLDSSHYAEEGLVGAVDGACATMTAISLRSVQAAMQAAAPNSAPPTTVHMRFVQDFVSPDWNASVRNLVMRGYFATSDGFHEVDPADEPFGTLDAIYLSSAPIINGPFPLRPSIYSAASETFAPDAEEDFDTTKLILECDIDFKTAEVSNVLITEE